MKKIIFSLVAFAALASACSKQENLQNTGKTIDAQISLFFRSPSITGRAFGSGTTEAWEKSVSKATLLVFNPSGNLVFNRVLTPAELTASNTTPITLSVPSSTVGDVYDFCVVANRTINANVTSKTLLLAELDNDAAAYNGTFTNVTTAAQRGDGFVMSGIQPQAIIDGVTSVAITLKREVAKVEIEAATTANFATAYGAAAIKVNTIAVSAAASEIFTIDQSTAKYAAGAMTFTTTQASNEVVSAPNKYQNLFYIFENNTLAAGSRVKLTLDTTFDIDGNFTTTTDQSPVTYVIELDGTAAGKILRNGAYKVVANINGLTGSDVSLSITIADWETLSTQNVDLGA